MESEAFAPPPQGAPPVPSRTRHVVYLGTLIPRKCVDVLVRAVARLPALELTVAGNDLGHGAQIRRAVREQGLEERVTWRGLVRGGERAPLLQGADVVAYPGRAEVFGLVPLEALLCGTPVVVSDDYGCGELVQAAGAGFLVPYAQPEALAKRIDLLLSDPERGRAMVKRGRRFIQDHFSWPGISERTTRVYRDVIAQRREEARPAL